MIFPTAVDMAGDTVVVEPQKYASWGLPLRVAAGSFSWELPLGASAGHFRWELPFSGAKNLIHTLKKRSPRNAYNLPYHFTKCICGKQIAPSFAIRFATINQLSKLVSQLLQPQAFRQILVPCGAVLLLNLYRNAFLISLSRHLFVILLD